jgi:hypothetical protein
MPRCDEAFVDRFLAPWNRHDVDTDSELVGLGASDFRLLRAETERPMSRTSADFQRYVA